MLAWSPMVKKPFMPNPGRIGGSNPSEPQPLRIILDVFPNGNIGFSSSRPVPMIVVISMMAGLIKEGAETIIKQSAGIIQVPKDIPDEVETEPEEDKEKVQ